MSKSQSAMEFVLLSSFMLLLILGFFSLASSKMIDAKLEGNRKIAQDITEFAYREVKIARAVNDGYYREFEMPQTINGIDYGMSVIDSRELVISYLDEEYVQFLPANVTGTLLKGNNRISKAKGIITLN